MSTIRRQIASAGRLTLFALWSLVFSIFILLTVVFRPSSLERPGRFVRFYSRVSVWLCGLQIELEGEENIEASVPCIYVCNHQSYFDFIIFGLRMPERLRIIGKKELLWIPLVGRLLRAIGTVFVDRGNRNQSSELLETVADEVVNKKICVVLMPEGTRNRGRDQLLPFKKGAFRLAKRAGVPIVATVCSSLRDCANLASLSLGGRVHVRVLPPMPSEQTPEELTRTTYLAMQSAFEELNAQQFSKPAIA